jgi:hypothetical protein
MNVLIELLRPRTTADAYALVTAATTIVLALVGIVGLSSLRLTKKDMINRELRQQKMTAIEQVKEFADVITPANAAFVTEINKLKIGTLVDAADVRFGAEEKKHLALAEQYRKKLGPEIDRTAILNLNAVEAWGMHFDEGLAIEEIAFHPCARAYCLLVTQYYGHLVSLRAQPHASGQFSSTVQRYLRWSSRIKREEDLKKGTSESSSNAE